MAASVVMTGCRKDDDGYDGGINDNYVGTWVADMYYENGNNKLLYPMGDLYDLPTITVNLKRNGECSGNGIVLNGKGTFAVKTGNKWDDGYWAIFTFMQNGEVVSTATLTSFTNDHKEGYVKLSGYDGKTFIFKRQ